MRGFFLGVGLLLAGAILGAGGAWYFLGGRLSEADRELGEYRDLVDGIRADHQGITDQTLRLGSSIDAVGRGITEAQNLASQAGVQSGNITSTLRKLVTDLKGLQGRIADLEDNYSDLRDDYSSLLDLVDSIVIAPVENPQNGDL